MPKISNISAKEMIKIAEKQGFTFCRQKGSHIILKKEDKMLVIPNHKKLKIGTTLQIIKIIDITKEDLENFK